MRFNQMGKHPNYCGSKGRTEGEGVEILVKIIVAKIFPCLGTLEIKVQEANRLLYCLSHKRHFQRHIIMKLSKSKLKCSKADREKAVQLREKPY